MNKNDDDVTTRIRRRNLFVASIMLCMLVLFFAFTYALRSPNEYLRWRRQAKSILFSVQESRGTGRRVVDVVTETSKCFGIDRFDDSLLIGRLAEKLGSSSSHLGVYWTGSDSVDDAVIIIPSPPHLHLDRVLVLNAANEIESIRVEELLDRLRTSVPMTCPR